MKQADIIIFGGQSNMQGQTNDHGDRTPMENAFEYKWIGDKFVPVQNPVGENIRMDGTEGIFFMDAPYRNVDRWLAEHALGAASSRCANIVPPFCKTYFAVTGRIPLAVHAAKGSTTIAQWLPGTQAFEILVGKAKAAIEKAKAEFSLGHVYFLWLQGESDAVEGNSKAYYKEKLLELNEALKAQLGIHKFGIIRVGQFVRDQRDWEIIDAQTETCAENADFLLLTDIAAGMYGLPEYMNPVAPGHFNVAAFHKLGTAAADTLGRYRNGCK